MKFKKILSEKVKLINPLLEKCLILDYRNEFQQMAFHIVKAGGKRLRPIMLLWACEAVGGDPLKILDAAIAMELMHTYSLIHDDILDESDYRRGVKAVHVIWGVKWAILIGDYLFNKAFVALNNLVKKKIPLQAILDAINTLAWATNEMIQGQDLDLFFEERNAVVTENEYINMAQKKTGSLMRASLQIGCILGGGSKEELNCLNEYGRNIGFAFQLQDDILDLVVNKKFIKKREPVGNDVKQGKQNLIFSHFFHHDNSQRKHIFHKVFGNKSAKEEDIKRVINLLSESRSIEYARKYANKLILHAKQNLKPLKKSEAKENLIALADYIIHRSY